MPLVAHTELPTFQKLREEGETILAPDRASHQDIREMHIGLLNMMPDAALQATERQFFRLVSHDVGAWWAMHSTPNPCGIRPDCKIHTHSKYGS